MRSVGYARDFLRVSPLFESPRRGHAERGFDEQERKPVRKRLGDDQFASPTTDGGALIDEEWHVAADFCRERREPFKR